ncbi:IS3 family transposase [uncultured Microbulbifer sp.]|uniref:IS3 family transposase n=1 Tax=uncultured Microbulbifer sp. TaxID=348147 RepID=UPI00345D664B
MKSKIRTIFDESAGRYGSPIIWKALQEKGYEVSRKRVARLMQELGLTGRVARVVRALISFSMAATLNKAMQPTSYFVHPLRGCFAPIFAQKAHKVSRP